jgi:hypothetical protein
MTVAGNGQAMPVRAINIRENWARSGADDESGDMHELGWIFGMSISDDAFTGLLAEDGSLGWRSSAPQFA